MSRLLPAWLVNLSDRLRTSFWFLPFLMALAAMALAVAMAQVDQHVRTEGPDGISWIYSGGAEGARAVLSTLAGSMITVAGVVYSITVVVLTLASSQYGPRLMRNFIGDRVNQTVLGVFVASFVYCLLVLRGIGSPQQGADFVPNLSVTVGVGLGVLSLLVLIYFIHHTATSIQAFSIIAKIGAELTEQITALFPDGIGEEEEEEDAFPRAALARGGAETCVRAPRSGYLRLVDDDKVMDFARDHDVLVELRMRPGDFVVRGDFVAAFTATADLDETERTKLLNAFIFGDQRTTVQDAHFPIDQLVEIALRALSPGVNDPFTAIQCIHRLGEALAALVQQSMPSPRRLIDGKLRVIAPAPGFAEFVGRIVDPLRLAAAQQPGVLVVLLEVLARAHGRSSHVGRRACLEKHARAIVATAQDALVGTRDQRMVRAAAEPLLGPRPVGVAAAQKMGETSS